MQVVIIEDEALAVERLEGLLRECEPNIKIAAKLDSVASSISWLSENRADLLFMDIELADGLCFSIFDNLMPTTPIIFVTAYDKYAIKAFELYSIDYLLKPIKKEELQKSLEKFKKFKKMLNPEIDQLLDYFKPEYVDYKKRFIVQVGDSLQAVQTKDIAFFYAMEKCTFFTTVKNETFSLDISLNKLELLLSPELFFRINRTIIINMNAIKKMIVLSRSRIKIETAPPTPNSIKCIVSIERSTAFRQWIDK